MIKSLKITFSIIPVWIIYVIVTTGLESNLFKERDFLGSIPWMRATLWDFYANALVIYLWICYKEPGILLKVMWLVAMICLGSIASCVYILIQLFRLGPGDGVRELLLNRHD